MGGYHVGVDAGGTRAVAVVVDEDGRELARGRAAGAVATVTSVTPAVDAVAAAVREALMAADVEAPVGKLWVGLAGAGREHVRAAAEADLAALGLADRVRVGTDVEAAFESAFGEGPGILLIAGTGSIALCRSPTGETFRTGGWGARLGDEGGGYWIGMHALGAVARAEDGRAQDTALRDALTRRLGLSARAELIDLVDRATKAEVAELAPTVLEIAASGDPVAASIATDAAAALRTHVVALLERLERAGLEWDTMELALWGGLIEADGPLRPTLDRLLAPLGFAVHTAPIDPPLGAARLASRLAG
ncbi:MAG: BadF/BadG/BcrA/BcrD ATPase family protein [Gemmatimonadota bacterium]